MSLFVEKENGRHKKTWKVVASVLLGITIAGFLYMAIYVDNFLEMIR